MTPDERAMVEAVAEVVSGAPEFCPETGSWHLDGLDHLGHEEIDALLEDIRRVLPPGWRAVWSMFDVRITKEAS